MAGLIRFSFPGEEQATRRLTPATLAGRAFISTDDGVTWTLRVTEIGGGFPAMARTGGTAVALGARGDLMVGITAEGWTCAGGGCTSGACEDAFLDVVPAGGLSMFDRGRPVVQLADGRGAIAGVLQAALHQHFA